MYNFPRQIKVIGGTIDFELTNLIERLRCIFSLALTGKITSRGGTVTINNPVEIKQKSDMGGSSWHISEQQ